MGNQIKMRRILFSQIKQRFDEMLNQLDADSHSGLEQLYSLQSAKQSGLKTEKERLAGMLNKEHPRIEALNARVDIFPNVLREISINIDRSSTELPKVDDSTWLIHGRVFSEELKGILELTVGLFHSNDGKQIKNFERTDKTGYFKFLHRQSETETKVADSGAGAPARKINITANICIFDSEGELMYEDGRILTLEFGQAIYREIILDSSVETWKIPPKSKPQTTRKTNTRKRKSK